MLQIAEKEYLKNNKTIVKSARAFLMVTMATPAASTTKSAALAIYHNHRKSILCIAISDYIKPFKKYSVAEF